MPLAMAQGKFPVCAPDGLTTMWDVVAAVVRAPQPVTAVGDLALGGQFPSKFELRVYLETADNNENVTIQVIIVQIEDRVRSPYKMASLPGLCSFD